MRILSCNIRYPYDGDGENHWIYRKGMCVDVIRSRAPQIICLQELYESQARDLEAAFPEFESYGMIDIPLYRHPLNTVFYHRDSFRRISSGGCWLSETPHVPGSKSWGSRCVRYMVWVALEDLGSKEEFRVINTHLDHRSQLARENQARLINEHAGAFPDEHPQILTGDMNCDATNATIDVLRKGGWEDTYAAIHGTVDPGHTIHDFLGPAHDTDQGKIDWIFTRGSVRVFDAEVIRDSRNGRFPSDHYFVSAEIEPMA